MGRHVSPRLGTSSPLSFQVRSDLRINGGEVVGTLSSYTNTNTNTICVIAKEWGEQILALAFVPIVATCVWNNERRGVLHRGLYRWLLDLYYLYRVKFVSIPQLEITPALSPGNIRRFIDTCASSGRAIPHPSAAHITKLDSLHPFRKSIRISIYSINVVYIQ